MIGESGPSFLLGLIGSGIQRSLTPAMHEREGAAHGFRTLYKIIDIDRLGLTPANLPELLEAAERFGFAGLNITHPCKQAVLPLLHEMSDAARELGAVNTVVLRDGRRIGHNTDVSGFAEGFRRGLPGVALHRAVQFGAGGAGTAVAHALLRLGIGHLTVVDVAEERAAALAGHLAEHFGPGRAAAAPADSPAAGDAVAAADGVINTTPIGMANHPGMAIPAALLRPALWVAEIVYFPLETELLARARAIGCRTVSGGGMAVFQAVDAFRLFTGAEPDPDRMLAHFAELQRAAA